MDRGQDCPGDWAASVTWRGEAQLHWHACSLRPSFRWWHRQAGSQHHLTVMMAMAKYTCVHCTTNPTACVYVFDALDIMLLATLPCSYILCWAGCDAEQQLCAAALQCLAVPAWAAL